MRGVNRRSCFWNNNNNKNKRKALIKRWGRRIDGGDRGRERSSFDKSDLLFIYIQLLSFVKVKKKRKIE